jgi:CubicO group peptidase (beta-lactamase class C family)
MKRAVLILVLGCVLWTLVASARGFSATRGQPTAESPQSKGSTAAAPNVSRMEQVILTFVQRKQFMGAVLVARGAEVLLDKGYGFADVELNVPASPKTKFRLGSVTKQFTAAAILLLQERGKLNVNDPVKKYLPDAPAAWDKITIYNLLTHTSGIPDFTSFTDYASLEPFATTPKELVARFREKTLDFQPGEQWRYSNSGYVLLGYLIEKISGESYAQFVIENIFKPLGMADSGYDSNSAIIQNRASGYTLSANGLVNAGYINMTVPLSAGGLYSTTEDLLRWEQGFFGGKLLSAASQQEMVTPFKNDYAFGLQVFKVNGHQVIDHEGGIEGFNTLLAYYPEDKLTVIVLGNVNGTAPQQIGRDLAKLAHGGDVTLPSEHKEVSIDPKLFDGYIGSYQLAPDFVLAVRRDGDHFIAQATGQGPVEIFPEGDHEFFAKVVDAQITFLTDSQGRATELILHQNGTDHHAPRIQ